MLDIVAPPVFKVDTLHEPAARTAANARDLQVYMSANGQAIQPLTVGQST